MARKRSPTTQPKKKTVPREPPALPPPVSDRRSYMQKWRQTQAIGYDAEKWAMLELEIGRFGVGASLACGFILVIVAYIASLLAAGADIPDFRRPELWLWFPLSFMSAVVSAFTMVKKIGPYRRGYRSAHFLSSIAAFAIAVVVLLFVVLDQWAVVDLGLVALAMWPASSLGMSLAFVSLALTWEGVGLRRLASMTSASLVPISLLLAPLLGVTYQSPVLILVYMFDVMFIVFAGSILLLIASSAEAAQREIIRASDTKLSATKAEMEQKLKALDYKEKAYVEREAHLEAKEKELLEIGTELDGRKGELNQVQAKLDQQAKNLSEVESKLAKMRAEVEVRVEEFALKDKDVSAARVQVEQARASLAEREQAVGEREKELKRSAIEVSSQKRAIDANRKELGDLRARLQKEGETIDVRRDEVIKLEKELRLKESEVKLKIDQLEAQQAGETTEKVRELKDWESKVLAKEREIANREASLQSMTEEIKQRQTDGDAYAAALQQERERLAAREQELNALEKRVSDTSSEAGERNAEIDRRWREVIETQKRLDGREAEYNSLFKDAKMREADFSTTQEEVARRMAAIDAREAKMKEWQENLGGETKRLQDKYRELLAKEKTIQSKESDLSLKSLEIEKREREAIRAPPSGGPVDVDKEKYFEMWEGRLKEREDEFKRRMYQKEKEMEAREMAMKEQLKTLAAGAVTPGAEVLEASVSVAADRGDKYKTGTARLDDLLYGGFPMNANILFVGPAFVGKEVAILNFIAEGLKSSVPAVIVTTSKPPVEISKEMAPVLPTFMEYENLGLVRWIDASGTTPTQKLTRDKNTFRVPNAADFDGLLEAVNEAEEEFREKNATHYRLAFLSLSSSLSQADEKVAIGFVQRFVNRLRQAKCIATFALERGMHTDQQVESLQQLMDGALVFKQDKSKTLMSVVGVGEVQTRDWVPYKFTNKALMIGSFQLERIR